MNFQDLKSIESAKFYIDVAFSRAKKKASRPVKIKDKTKRAKQTEIVRLTCVKDTLIDQMFKIVRAYPDLEGLPMFYRELVKCTIDYATLKKSLGAVNWVITQAKNLTSEYLVRIKKCQDQAKMREYRSQYFGRISSVLKQVNKNLKFLEQSRKIMRNYPSIKTSLPTVALVGFPNVGKTTLLSKLTGSKAEINSYAFTTKGVNVGYVKVSYKKLQVLDTPGTLNRFEKMNAIEKQAHLAIKYCAHLLVYVFDLTESSYPLKDQLKLYKQTKKENPDKEMVIYLSKTDLLKKETIAEFKHRGLSFDTLKETLATFLTSRR